MAIKLPDLFRHRRRHRRGRAGPVNIAPALPMVPSPTDADARPIRLARALQSSISPSAGPAPSRPGPDHRPTTHPARGRFRKLARHIWAGPY
jgi:hypothetical protein